jgi:hypothetical protein
VTKLVWDKSGSRRFETGVDRGVLYPGTDSGVSWNGLVSVTESPSGGEASPQYSDNIKYLNLVSDEEFGGTIEAFGSPREFAKCDGSSSPFAGLSLGQQPRKSFGLSYRTKIGTDLDSDRGYKIHLVYNALAAPSEKAYGTVNDSPEAISFSWEFTTTPMYIRRAYRPTSHIAISSLSVSSNLLRTIESILYGSETAAPRIIFPAELLTLIENEPVFLAVVPDEDTGIASLVDGGVDLTTGTTDGVYTTPPDSRLTETTTPGRYTLEP